MDTLIKKRKPVRMLFTKCYNVLIEEFEKEDVDRELIKVKFTSLERFKDQLSVLGDEVCNVLLEKEKL